MNKTVQDLNGNKSNKENTKGSNHEDGKLRKEKRNYRHKYHQQIPEIEERISGIEDTIEEIDTLVKKKMPNLKSI
jgi:septation ring formation regulator EzrA